MFYICITDKVLEFRFNGLPLVLTISAFTEWRLKEEEEKKVNYVQYTAPKQRKDGLRYYFVCHRSYDKDQRATKNVRESKSQGTNKIGKACPSTITATDSKENGVIAVYCEVHVGHIAELGRQRIPRCDRQELAGKNK